MFESHIAAGKGRRQPGSFFLRRSGGQSPRVSEKHSKPTAVHSAASDGEIAIYGELGAIEREWREFETRADCTVFQTYDWLATWQNRIGNPAGIVPLVVVGRDQDRRILFILSLMLASHGPWRRLSWLGSDLCDYNAPMLAAHFSQRIDPERFVDLWRDVTRLVRRHVRYDLIDLQKMPQRIGAQQNPFLNLKVIAAASGAHSTALGKDWDAFYAAKRSAATRQRDRNKLKRLTAHGEVRFTTAEREEDIAGTLDWLLDQKTQSLARMGISSPFGRAQTRQFYLDVATSPSRRADVSRLDIGPVVATASFGLIFRGAYHYLVASYQSGELARFGAGNVHLHHLLRRAIDLGLDRFDFTIGDEPYKQNWCDVEEKLYDHVSAATLRGALAVSVLGLLRRLKRVIKREPVLWNAFVRLRTLAGTLKGRSAGNA